MRHAVLDEEQRTLAALHALHALEPAEAAAFAEHLQECPACATEVASYAGTSAALAEAAAVGVAPPPGLRDRLLAMAAAEPPPADDFVFLDRDEHPWREVAPGVFRQDLAGEPSPSYLIRLAPGATIATHPHARIEHCLVLDGEVTFAGRTMRAGAYHRAAPSTVHDRVHSVGGCTFLVVEAAG